MNNKRSTYKKKRKYLLLEKNQKNRSVTARILLSLQMDDENEDNVKANYDRPIT